MSKRTFSAVTITCVASILLLVKITTPWSYYVIDRSTSSRKHTDSIHNISDITASTQMNMGQAKPNSGITMAVHLQRQLPLGGFGLPLQIEQHTGELPKRIPGFLSHSNSAKNLSALTADMRDFLQSYKRTCLKYSQNLTAKLLHQYVIMEHAKVDNNTMSCDCFKEGKQDSITDFPTFINETGNLTWTDLEKKHKEVVAGGIWKPCDCVARQHIAIIVPYRDRDQHLRIFLHYIHPFLQRQQSSYRIFIVEQSSPEVFNRAVMLNIGYTEAGLNDTFDCYIFHDVDLLPESYYHFYNCLNSPTHFGAYMNKHKYSLPYHSFIGGALAMTSQQIQAVNGFSNRYYGWGGEDDDMEIRLKWKSLRLRRYPLFVGKSFMIKHDHDDKNPVNPRKFKLLSNREPDKDGLSSLKYVVHKKENRKLYTWILVSIERELDESCLIDHKKPPEAEGNYLDCLDEENFRNGKQDCCMSDVNNTLVCCNRDAS